MNILAIETAFEACSVALQTPAGSLSRFERAPRGHAERVLPWVDGLLREAKLRPADLDAIAFSRGPGSFTSLRIGISVVQGLAWGADVPVVPLSSLRITAQVAAETGLDKVLVAMDARMGEVFCGLYEADEGGVMRPLGIERVCAPEQAAELASADFSGVGNGFARYEALANCRKTLRSIAPDTWPDARTMLPLSQDSMERHAPLPAAQAQPVYLRDKVAEKASSA